MSDANLGLFNNERETNLESTIAMVEDVLLELGHFINNARVDLDGAVKAWRVKKGSAETLIAIVDRDEFTQLRATATVLTLDGSVDRTALFTRLLELNESELRGIAFAIKDDQVRIVAERSTLDLDRSEVLSVVDRVREAADTYDDALVTEFGGTLGGSVLI